LRLNGFGWRALQVIWLTPAMELKALHTRLQEQGATTRAPGRIITHGRILPVTCIPSAAFIICPIPFRIYGNTTLMMIPGLGYTERQVIQPHLILVPMAKMQYRVPRQCLPRTMCPAAGQAVKDGRTV